MNFNGDKCYEHAVDRVACPFNYTNNLKACFGTILEESSSCNVLREKFMHYRLPMQFSVDLEPRTSCGVSVYAYSALLQTAHKYPVTMYHTWGEKQLNHFDTRYLVWSGMRGSAEDCLYNECQNEYQLDAQTQQFYMVNWDRNYKKTIHFRIVENSAKFLISAPLLLLAWALF